MTYDLGVIKRQRYVSPPYLGLGGTTSNYTVGGINYTVHIFTASGTFFVLAPGTIEYLVVAGGGGGGWAHAGGGGAGGYLTGSYNAIAGGFLTVTVGAAGPAATGRAANGTNGSNSVFATIIALGGGGGGSEYKVGTVGGSGGGGATGAAGALGTVGQGNNGGTSSKDYAGGGGGGAGAVGSNTSATSAGNGGVGLSSSISGTATYYAGGGGGGCYGGTNGVTSSGTGGTGGGGNGNYGNGNGSAGTVNTGGGGGGGGYFGEGGYAGGSGIVIIRYPTPVNSQLFNDPYFNSTSLLLTGRTEAYPSVVDYIVVAGGGAGGTNVGGGGGAGGLIQVLSFAAPWQTKTYYTVTIGAGGASAGASGGNSSFSTTAVSGGGGGANAAANGSAGGSGGGGGWFGGQTGGAGTAGQGYAGAASTGAYYAGGGGGAGAASTSAEGGAGAEWPTSSGIFYAKGGGGGYSSTVGATAAANTGNGGSGGTYGGAGGNGGSGVVIIRYDAKSAPAITTGNPTIEVSNGYRYYTFKTSGSIQWGSDNTFRDSSYNALTVTPAGTPTQGSVSPFSQNWSGYFNGTSYLTTPYSISTVQWWDTDYTIEMWIYNTVNAQTVSGLPLQIGYGAPTTDATYWAFGTNSSGNLYFYYYNGAAVASAIGTTPVPLNTWNHIAIVYNNSTAILKGYINGVQAFSVAKAGTPQAPSGSTINLGRVQNVGYTGYISNLRIVRGTAVYTGAFTPTTAPLPVITNTTLLTCASNRFLDNSGTTSTITAVGSPSVKPLAPFRGNDYNALVQGGSAYFNGSTDYLAAPITAGLTFGSGGTVSPMTAEAWFYTTTTPGTDQTVISQYASGSSGWSIRLLSGVIRAALTGDTTLITGTTSLKSNNWYHVALSGSAGSWKLFLNGLQEGATQTSSVTMGDTAAVVVGRLSSVSYFNGYISNVRVIKDTVLYTTNFTPPLAPVTAIANTSLLLNFTNATIIDYTGQTNPLSVNTATLSTSIVKYNTRSVKFNGVADYLKLPAISDAFVFGTGNFTVEYWVYYTALPASVTVICGNATGAAGLAFGASSTAKLHMFSNTTAYTSTGATLVTGQWYHVAFVRESGGVKYYLNGSLDYTVAVSTSITELTGSVGAKTGGTLYSNCYIDDLRVTKGVARYLSAFTPSSVKTQIK